MDSFDHIIIGHGLAGATLAIELRNRGLSVCVFDEAKPVTASRVAAGLMTPITGKRFALTPKWEELWPTAVRFYREFERETNQAVLTETPALRLFKTADDAQWFEKRRESMGRFVEEPKQNSNLVCEHGGIQMRHTGRLNVSRFLDTAGRNLDRLVHTTRPVGFDDIRIAAQGIRVHEISARHITWCNGYRPEQNPWFPEVKFEAAKGEVLILRVGGLNESRTVHANGLWMAPLGNDTYRVGATYDWNQLDFEPTPEAKQQLIDRVEQFLKIPFDIIDHVAAVRPIVYGRQPVAGLSQRSSRCGYINGMGSKGALLAPSIASMYADFLEGSREIHPDYDLHQRFQ